MKKVLKEKYKKYYFICQHCGSLIEIDYDDVSSHFVGGEKRIKCTCPNCFDTHDVPALNFIKQSEKLENMEINKTGFSSNLLSNLLSNIDPDYLVFFVFIGFIFLTAMIYLIFRCLWLGGI